MHRHLIALSVSLALHACALSKLTTANMPVGDPNDPVVKAVDNVAQALFEHEQPLVNEAIATLPSEAQALAQAAYVALEQAVKKAGELTVGNLSQAEHATAINATNDLASIAKILHETIHDPNAAAILQAP